MGLSAYVNALSRARSRSYPESRIRLTCEWHGFINNYRRCRCDNYALCPTYPSNYGANYGRRRTPRLGDSRLRKILGARGLSEKIARAHESWKMRAWIRTANLRNTTSCFTLLSHEDTRINTRRFRTRAICHVVTTHKHPRQTRLSAARAMEFPAWARREKKMRMAPWDDSFSDPTNTTARKRGRKWEKKDRDSAAAGLFKCARRGNTEISTDANICRGRRRKGQKLNRTSITLD